MSIFGHDGIDICHGRLSLYGWMDCPNQGLGAAVQVRNLVMMDVYLNGYEIIIHIIIRGTTMDDDSTNIVYCVLVHAIILCGF